MAALACRLAGAGSYIRPNRQESVSRRKPLTRADSRPAGEGSSRIAAAEKRTADAVKKADSAAQNATKALDAVTSLPGASWEDWARLNYKREKEEAVGRVVRPIARVLLLTAFLASLWAVERAPLPLRALGSFLIAVLVGLRGFSSSALDASGAMGAAVVGTLTLGSGLRFGAVLLAFYFASSAITKASPSLLWATGPLSSLTRWGDAPPPLLWVTRVMLPVHFPFAPSPSPPRVGPGPRLG